jgi:hypothetical protein
MNLDDHARQAADRLRANDPTPSAVAATHDLVLGESAGRRRRQRAARVGLAAVAAVGALGVAAIAMSNPGAPRPDDATGTTTTTPSPLDLMPSSPIDGKASWRFPVVVEQQSGLHDGDTVTVYGRGFTPNSSVGLVMCGAEADVDGAGVGGCDLSAPEGQGAFDHVTYGNANEAGDVIASFQVRRFIDTPVGGRIDCQSAAERCLIAVAQVSDYDRSGGSYVNFADAPPFPTSALTVAPTTDLTPGTAVQVDITDWMPKRPVRLELCRGDTCQTLQDGAADEAGAFRATVVVPNAVIDSQRDGAEPTACGGDCVLRATGIGVAGASSQPFPDPVPLTFTDAPTVTAPVPTTTTVPPETTVPGSESTVECTGAIGESQVCVHQDPDGGTHTEIVPGTHATATTAPGA